MVQAAKAQTKQSSTEGSIAISNSRWTSSNGSVVARARSGPTRLLDQLGPEQLEAARRRFDDMFDGRLSGGGRRGGRGFRALLFGCFRGCDLGLGFGPGLFKILNGELELLDQQLAAFGGLHELFPP